MQKLLIIFALFLNFAIQTANAASKKVLWVPLSGTVELGLSPYILRAIDYAEKNEMDALVLDIDTFGGRIDAAVTIRDALLNSKVLTIAWVNKRAISAGALISFASQKIFFSPGSTMGAATPIEMGVEGAKPVENKIVSYFRAEMGSTAERNGRSRKIAEAMVSATEDIPGLVKKGDVLTLTDKTAETAKISDGLVSTQEELFRKMKWENVEVKDFKINWAEKIVRLITDPTVSSLLMSGGMLGLFLEFQAPGLSLPGIFGVTCLALYFFGKWIVHLAGFEEIILMVLGLILILIELFLIPGKFVPGVVGGILVFVALLMSGLSPKIPFDLSFPDVRVHLNSVAISILVAFGTLIFAAFFMSRHPRKSPLVMNDSLDSTQGYSSFDSRQNLLDKIGRVTVDLRPTGKANIDGQIYEVNSQSEWIKEGSEVRVTLVDGPRIFVEKLKEPLS